MSEEDDGLSNSKSASVIDSDSESSDSDLDLSDDLKQSSEYRELLELKALRQMKLSSGQYDHYGYKVTVSRVMHHSTTVGPDLIAIEMLTFPSKSSRNQNENDLTKVTP